MATTPDLHEPQIAAARAQAWHQAGEPLLTLEAARTFLNDHGFVLFAPQALGAPAPSLLEATLGAAKHTAASADAQTARGLVARLVGEGFAVPLNLLGGPGDLPDFIVSTAAFPFVFTLRGDKGWKRPPETSGAVRVTPLALRVYELLSERGAMSVSELVTETGREVTDSAVSRALNELWALLRVIPALQQGEGDTLWEVITARFVKAVKAGANAGQPTALSALISLYLGQALIATEEEITSFLSPLTARSRVRDVLHGLVAGRQLNEAVLEGKTVLYIPDALPDFAQFAPAEKAAASAEGEDQVAADSTPEETGTGERIRRFGAGEGAERDRNLRGKPVARKGGARGPASRPPTGDRPARRAGTERPARRSGARSDRPRPGADRRAPPQNRAEGTERPARRPATDRPSRPEGPSYTRPWNEGAGSRPSREGSGESRSGTRPPRREGAGPSKPPFRRKESGGEAKPFRRDATGGARPPFRKDATAGTRPPFRKNAAGGERRPYRKEGSEAARRPFRRDASAGGERPYTREGGSDRPFTRRPPKADGERPTPRRRTFSPESQESGPADRGAGRSPRDDRGGPGKTSFRPRPDRGEGARSDRGPARGSFSRDRDRGPGGGPDRPRGPRPGGGESSRPGSPARGFGRGAPGRPGPRAGAGGEGRDFGKRPGGARGTGPGRPQGRAGGGGGFRDRGGPGQGPKRGGPAKGASRSRPAPGSAPRPRPEDEA